MKTSNFKQLMNQIFQIVFQILSSLSKLIGLTYQEINVVVYYMLFPLSVLFVVERCFKVKFLSLIAALLLSIMFFLIPDFKSFSASLFDSSVNFLKMFEVFGLNYIEASVVVCVIAPVFVVVSLFYVKRAKLIN